MDSLQPTIIGIGPFRLDLAQGRLTGTHGDIPIRPKTLALLACLARRGGHVLTRDDLMAAVWPGLIVTDDSLTQGIRDVRRVLGPDHAGLLRTLSGRGYVLDGCATADDPRPDIPANAVAVLPIAHRAGATAEEQLVCDGLTHDLITGLAMMREFQVMGRGSSFAMREGADSVARLRDWLGVAFVVTGHVVPGGQGLRLKLDLVRTDSGALVWTTDLPLNMTDIQPTRTDAINRCVAAMAQALTLSERHRVAALRDQPQAAWEAFHAGLNHLFGPADDGLARALESFRLARRLDPGSARSAAYESSCHYFMAFEQQGPDRAENTRLAIAAADAALSADESSPVAHWAFGRARYLKADIAATLDHCGQAVALCPSFPAAHYMLGFVEAMHRDAGRALDHLDHCERLSPLDPFMDAVRLTRAFAHLRLGQTDAARRDAEQVSRASMPSASMLCGAFVVLLATGNPQAARVAAQEMYTCRPGFGVADLLATLHGPTVIAPELLPFFEQAMQDTGPAGQ
jgi:TolB-like protein